jgi:hypothetical protein
MRRVERRAACVLPLVEHLDHRSANTSRQKNGDKQSPDAALHVADGSTLKAVSRGMLDKLCATLRKYS